jgi:catechol 2,3-dioxygenase-like lactoylglutathione lyase family enzyme
MQHSPISIRPFIGAKDFELSRTFYRDLGCQESVLSYNLSVFKMGNIAFYLQAYYLKDWVDNTMVFVEVKDVDAYWQEVMALNLTAKYPAAKLVPIRVNDWGKEFFLHDPSGILWHFGQFSESK